MERFAEIVQHSHFGRLDWVIPIVYLMTTITFGMIARKYRPS
jgi:hypothetical protein